jgi:hypothetical protein
MFEVNKHIFNNHILSIIPFEFRYKFWIFSPIIIEFSIKPSPEPTSDPPRHSRDGTTALDGTVFGTTALDSTVFGTTALDGTVFGTTAVDGTVFGTTALDGTVFGTTALDGTVSLCSISFWS